MASFLKVTILMFKMKTNAWIQRKSRQDSVTVSWLIFLVNRSTPRHPASQGGVKVRKVRAFNVGVQRA